MMSGFWTLLAACMAACATLQVAAEHIGAGVVAAIIGLTSAVLAVASK